MVKVIQITETHRDFWDESITQFDLCHPLNAFGWGIVRSIDGWTPIYLLAKREERVVGAMLCMSKRLPGTWLSVMYAQKGPLYRLGDSETLENLLKAAIDEARRRHAIFMRIDPNIEEDAINQTEDPFVSSGFVHLDHRWTFWNSPRDVSRIDLTRAGDESQLFNLVDRDARRCVRKAYKENVLIRPAESIDELKAFYGIFKEFSVTKGFMSRGFAYQKALWDEFISRGNGRLFLAIYEGEIIGGLICLMFGRKCLAMHMGTPYRFQKLQTYYAYVWESIKWAKENNCEWYSFRGTGTTVSQEYFKKKFGPRHVALVGYYDLPFRGAVYKALSSLEFAALPRVWRSLMTLRDRSRNLAKDLKQHRPPAGNQPEPDKAVSNA